MISSSRVVSLPLTKEGESASKPVPARFCDGVSARVFEVKLRFTDDAGLIVSGQNFEFCCSASDFRLQPSVGNAPRFVHFKNGSTCQITDLIALDHALAALPQRFFVPGRTAGWRIALVGIIFLPLTLWLVLSEGIPFIARQAAFAMPEQTVLQLGAGTLADLDETVFLPSRLPQDRINKFLYKSRKFLAQVGEPTDRRIEFRSAPAMGPNALALPSGVIVFTDDIVRLATNDEQLLAVLAHECGHVHHRHSLRGVLQNSVVMMAITLASGRKRNLDSTQAAISAQLLSSGYSREFEFEADAYAAELLRRAHIPVSRLGEMLDLLEHNANRAGSQSDNFDVYLHSHPATAERKERLLSPSS